MPQRGPRKRVGRTCLTAKTSKAGCSTAGTRNTPCRRVRSWGIRSPTRATRSSARKRDYANFILELEFNVQNGLNSGVQVRSQCFETPKSVVLGGKRFAFPADRVHGYQVEIDPSKRAWTGGIYDEGRRGWLFDLKHNEAARHAFKPEAWNTFRIECKGDLIKTWLNGVPAAELHDAVTPSGFIALQVHGVGKKTQPLKVRFRNLRIKELD